MFNVYIRIRAHIPGYIVMPAAHPQGLSDSEVIVNRNRYGANKQLDKGGSHFFRIVLDIVSEPLFIILVCAAGIYFVLGSANEGVIMLVALCLVAAISLFQENRSRNAVSALKKLTAPQARVIRNGKLLNTDPAELVMHDLLSLVDGDIVPADALVVEAHDLEVNESIITGESLPVGKTDRAGNNRLFSGTAITAGSCLARVSAVGAQTSLGQISGSLSAIRTSKTPLQLQIRSFVRSLVGIGAIAFVLVWAYNYYLSGSILHGLLHGLTLAMSILPEEIPVAFSTFMALGAYKLYRKKVIALSPHTVETLGAATVICADKTGTITENSMRLSVIYEHSTKKTINYQPDQVTEFNPVLEYAMWSSEARPFDNMERSIHDCYSSAVSEDLRDGAIMIKEYPLGGSPPMMTHVFKDKRGQIHIAVKGSPEAVLRHSELSGPEKEEMALIAKKLSAGGLRILGVGKGVHTHGELPPAQEKFVFEFLGLIAFADPPKKNIARVIRSFGEAGIDFKMITGDFPETALAIATQVKMNHHGQVLTGDEVNAMPEDLLEKKVREVHIFARMFPAAKMKVVEALKKNGEVVAMTGDGVNDAPALKAAHIGIAMGLRGSELAKRSASLILADDDLGNMTDAVALGRRIYENLKKAILYIISVHIPIVLIVTVPLVLFWDFTDIFSPVHVIFLELIMGPTCSIVFENEPMEPSAMKRPPRKMNTRFFSIHELGLSIIQGLAISAVCLGTGYYFLRLGRSENEVRSVIYATLIFSNVFLTLTARSLHHSMLSTLRFRNPMVPVVLGISVLVLLLSLYAEPLQKLFRFSGLRAGELAACVALAFAGTGWMELYKLVKRLTKKTSSQAA